jgi:PAS domain-containing protein
MGPEPGTFRALIERCPMVTYVADARDRLTYISPQISEWTGLPSRLWVEDPEWWLGMIHPDDLDGVLEAAVPLNVEYRMWARDRWCDGASRTGHSPRRRRSSRTPRAPG